MVSSNKEPVQSARKKMKQPKGKPSEATYKAEEAALRRMLEIQKEKSRLKRKRQEEKANVGRGKGYTGKRPRRGGSMNVTNKKQEPGMEQGPSVLPRNVMNKIARLTNQGTYGRVRTISKNMHAHQLDITEDVTYERGFIILLEEVLSVVKGAIPDDFRVTELVIEFKSARLNGKLKCKCTVSYRELPHRSKERVYELTTVKYTSNVQRNGLKKAKTKLYDVNQCQGKIEKVHMNQESGLMYRDCVGGFKDHKDILKAFLIAGSEGGVGCKVKYKAQTKEKDVSIVPVLDIRDVNEETAWEGAGVIKRKLNYIKDMLTSKLQNRSKNISGITAPSYTRASVAYQGSSQALYRQQITNPTTIPIYKSVTDHKPPLALQYNPTAPTGPRTRP